MRRAARPAAGRGRSHVPGWTSRAVRPAQGPHIVPDSQLPARVSATRRWNRPAGTNAAPSLDLSRHDGRSVAGGQPPRAAAAAADGLRHTSRSRWGVVLLCAVSRWPHGRGSGARRETSTDRRQPRSGGMTCGRGRGCRPAGRAAVRLSEPLAIQTVEEGRATPGGLGARRAPPRPKAWSERSRRRWSRALLRRPWPGRPADRRRPPARARLHPGTRPRSTPSVDQVTGELTVLLLGLNPDQRRRAGRGAAPAPGSGARPEQPAGQQPPPSSRTVLERVVLERLIGDDAARRRATPWRLLGAVGRRDLRGERGRDRNDALRAARGASSRGRRGSLCAWTGRRARRCGPPSGSRTRRASRRLSSASLGSGVARGCWPLRSRLDRHRWAVMPSAAWAWAGAGRASSRLLLDAGDDRPASSLRITEQVRPRRPHSRPPPGHASPTSSVAPSLDGLGSPLRALLAERGARRADRRARLRVGAADRRRRLEDAVAARADIATTVHNAAFFRGPSSTTPRTSSRIRATRAGREVMVSTRAERPLAVTGGWRAHRRDPPRSSITISFYSSDAARRIETFEREASVDVEPSPSPPPTRTSSRARARLVERLGGAGFKITDTAGAHAVIYAKCVRRPSPGASRERLHRAGAGEGGRGGAGTARPAAGPGGADVQRDRDGDRGGAPPPPTQTNEHARSGATRSLNRRPPPAAAPAPADALSRGRPRARPSVPAWSSSAMKRPVGTVARSCPRRRRDRLPHVVLGGRVANSRAPEHQRRAGDQAAGVGPRRAPGRSHAAAR